MSRLTQLCESAGKYLAASPDFEESRIVLLGAPMDYTVSFRPGSRSGPQAIRQASYGLEEYSIYSRKDLTQIRFFDAGDIALPVGDPLASLARIEEAVDSIVTGHKFPLLLGGEHLVSLGALRALSRHYQGLAVVHLDAHADLRTDYLGVAHSHASVMYHAHRELGLELYQFGIRSATADELEYANKYTHFYPFHVLEPLKTTLDSLRGRPVYFSLDIDVADPAFAPGTGTPEPGGITSTELLEVAALLGRLQLVGMDLVEVSPVYDLAGITAMLAAKVIREIILLQG